MRFLNDVLLSAVSNNATTNSSFIDASFIAQMSVIGLSTGTPAGTLKVQASNDHGQLLAGFTPTNWVDVPNGSVAISTSGVSIIPTLNISYQWLRLVYTDTGAGSQSVTFSADSSGSLNSKYFLLNSGNNVGLYYVWLNVNSAGVDPAIAGRTGIEVDVATSANATTIAAAAATAISAVHGAADFSATNMAGVLTIVNLVAGPFTPAVDGNTGFTFATLAPLGNLTATIKTNGY